MKQEITMRIENLDDVAEFARTVIRNGIKQRYIRCRDATRQRLISIREPNVSFRGSIFLSSLWGS